MSGNAMTCSQCGTENPPGRDYCVKCGAPLTASAEEAVRTNLDAQERGSLLAPDQSELGPGAVVAPGPELGAAGGIATPLPPDVGVDTTGAVNRPGHTEGLPRRHS